VLAASEFAFDSKVCSFGFSTDSLSGAVSMKGGSFGVGGGGGADRSTMVSSTGLSSSGDAGVKLLPNAASENPTRKCRKSDIKIASATFRLSRFCSIICRWGGSCYSL
jgi:hypothetical protein